ncbi:hypothetical protein GCM10011491_41170 [Brucella endophytica]|uniref:DUF736 domain-containing protein n=1 Tax=Brucella endophytica TaxID=1963359 RepID=A0A916WK39_9HYPH|nr:DUF736 family protein [Brucella endophytica]GGB08967.1 hypothetical protein GCM10011491_41170 [Brucella endophytica]
MATIGTVAKNGRGIYEGRLTTLTLNAPIKIIPMDRTSENAPTHRIVSGSAEVGAVWTKTSKTSGNEYLSLTFDTPELDYVIYATLGMAAGQDDPDVYSIIWNRPKPTHSR